jgi:hypothetical protein
MDGERHQGILFFFNDIWRDGLLKVDDGRLIVRAAP